MSFECVSRVRDGFTDGNGVDLLNEKHAVKGSVALNLPG